MTGSLPDVDFFRQAKTFLHDGDMFGMDIAQVGALIMRSGS